MGASFVVHCIVVACDEVHSVVVHSVVVHSVLWFIVLWVPVLWFTVLWLPVLWFIVLWWFSHCVVVLIVLINVACGSLCCCQCGKWCCGYHVPDPPLEGCGVIPSPLSEVVQDSRIMHT